MNERTGVLLGNRRVIEQPPLLVPVLHDPVAPQGTPDEARRLPPTGEGWR